MTNVDDLKSHHASWHKSCHLKYSVKLARETKRKSSHAEESVRTSSKCQAMDIKNCIEKGPEQGDLHQILTFDADASI